MTKTTAPQKTVARKPAAAAAAKGPTPDQIAAALTSMVAASAILSNAKPIAVGKALKILLQADEQREAAASDETDASDDTAEDEGADEAEGITSDEDDASDDTSVEDEDEDEDEDEVPASKAVRRTAAPAPKEKAVTPPSKVEKAKLVKAEALVGKRVITKRGRDTDDGKPEFRLISAAQFNAQGIACVAMRVIPPKGEQARGRFRLVPVDDIHTNSKGTLTMFPPAA